MNVLILSELFYPQGGGAELAAYLFSKLLKTEGFNTIVVTNRFPGEPEITRDEKLCIYRLPMFEPSESSKFSALVRVDILGSRLMRKLMEWTDVVYIPRYWFSAILLAKAFRKPVIVHLHDYIPLCPLSTKYDISKERVCSCPRAFCSFRCIYALEKSSGSTEFKTMSSMVLNSILGRFLGRLSELSDAVICASVAQRDVIVSRRPSLLSKISVIRNPLPEVEQVKIEGNDFAYFGGPNRLKGFHILYGAVSNMDQHIRRKANVHISDFSRISPEFSRRLRSKGFVPYGRLTGSAYDGVYAQTRSVLFPSTCLEVAPYVCVETLLRERLLIASNIGGIPEIVVGCPGAFTFPPGDINELARTMNYVQDFSNDVVTDLGARNREKLTRKFDNRQVARSFVKLLMRVQGQSK